MISKTQPGMPRCPNAQAGMPSNSRAPNSSHEDSALKWWEQRTWARSFLRDHRVRGTKLCYPNHCLLFGHRNYIEMEKSETKGFGGLKEKKRTTIKYRMESKRCRNETKFKILRVVPPNSSIYWDQTSVQFYLQGNIHQFPIYFNLQLDCVPFVWGT